MKKYIAGRSLAGALLSLLALMGLWSCGITPEPQSQNTGSLSISLGSSGVMASIVQPELAMVIATYEVTLTGPGDTVTLTLESTVDSKVFTNLLPGEWTTTVDAKNADGTVIARGSDSATVEVAQTASVNITVVPLSGNGTLDLSISWPADLLENPGVVASLTPREGSATDLSFTVDGEASPETASYSGAWAAGYYTLSLKLNDDTSAMWSKVVVVRIIEGQTSSASYALTEDNLGNPADPETFGALEVNIGASLQNPYSLSLSGNQATLQRDEAMTVSSTLADEASEPQYQWYINGQLQSEQSGSSIVIVGSESTESGVQLNHGRYTLDLLVSSGETITSQSLFFDIPQYKLGDNGPAGGVVFYDKGKVTDGWRYLEAWTADEPGTYRWRTTGTLGTTSREIGSGFNNTYGALAGDGFPAALAAREATHGGRGDWFLPSLDELVELYGQREAVGAFTAGSYWSSNPYNSSSAYYVRLNTGSPTYTSMSEPFLVRVIRRF